MSVVPQAALLDGRGPVPGSLRAGEPLTVAGLREPTVSAHLAVLLRQPLDGDVSPVRALLAVEAVTGALLVADTGEPVGVLAGPVARPAGEVDLMLEGCLLEVDGQIVDSAAAAAVRLGEALSDAARAEAVSPGPLWVSRALTEPVTVRAGLRVAAHFSTLGSSTVALR